MPYQYKQFKLRPEIHKEIKKRSAEEKKTANDYLEDLLARDKKLINKI